MSSLVESRRDNDAATDCSTRSAMISGHGRHGRLPQTSRSLAVAVGGPASSASYRVGASSSAAEMDGDGDSAVQQGGPPLSMFYNDASSSSPRLSLKPDVAERGDIDEPSTEHDSDAKLAVGAPDNVVVDVELQTGSGDAGSRNVLETDYNAAGEMRSRSADVASNSVEERCVDDDRRSRDDCYLPTGGAVDIATSEEPPCNWKCDSDQRKIVFGIEPTEQTVKARCQPHVDDSAQRCSERRSNNGYSAAGPNLMPKSQSPEAGNRNKALSWSYCSQADVKLEVDESQTNGADGDVDSVTSSRFRPFTAGSSSQSGESPNHTMSTCSGTQYRSYGVAGSSDVIAANTAAGALFDRSFVRSCFH